MSYAESPPPQTSGVSSEDSVEYGESGAAPPASHAGTWTDGYGRAHATGAEMSADGAPPLTPDERQARMSPWHGYDSKCDETGGRAD